MIWCISEQDAKTKTCPLSIGVCGTCVGNQCMAWRYVETHIKDDAGDLTVLSGDTHGYCGMAGQPWGRK